MLNVPYVPTLTARYTALHEWRMPQVGDVFGVGAYTYQTEAILPVNGANDTYQARVLIRRLGSLVTFLEPLNRLWAIWDALETRDGNGVRFTSDYIGKARRRNLEKVRKHRQYLHQMLVKEGLLDCAV